MANVNSNNEDLVLNAGGAGSKVKVSLDGVVQGDVVHTDASGNVGIGTSSPNAKLQVGAPTDTAGIAMIIQNGGFGTFIEHNSSVSHIYGNSSIRGLALGTNSTERMRIDSSGKVGIGTSSPNENMHIHNAGTKSAIQFSNSNTGSLAGDGLDIGYDSKAFIWNAENTEMVFATNNTERMRIDSTGSIKFGTYGSLRNVRNFRYSSTSRLGGTYIHLKTNRLTSSGAQMYSLTFRGHSFSEAKPIDTSLSFYSYSTLDNVINVGSYGTHTASAYRSSDGYVVLTLYIPSHYYVSFTYDQFTTAQGLNELVVTSYTTSSSSTGVY